jgi:hypothetical protein
MAFAQDFQKREGGSKQEGTYECKLPIYLSTERKNTMPALD